MNRHFESKFIRTNGVRLHVVQAGPEGGRLILLLHGFPEFWWAWNKQIQPLAEAGYQVWIPDQRGYNLSDKPDNLEAYRLNELAADILGLIDASGRRKAVVVGHDWGAMVAWWLGIRYPNWLDKLVILNVPHPKVFKDTVMSSPEQMLRSWYAMFFQIPGLPEAILRNNDWEKGIEILRRSSRTGDDGQSLAFDEQDFEQYRTAWWQKGAMTGMLNWYRANFRMPPELSGDMRVHVPTLILWGAQDIALSRKLAEPSLEKCDQGELVVFEEASHWVQHEEANAVTQAIIDFSA